MLTHTLYQPADSDGPECIAGLIIDPYDPTNPDKDRERAVVVFATHAQVLTRTDLDRLEGGDS